MKKQKQYRKTYAEINLANLRGNYARVQKHIGPGKGIMAVVKANAYGHGDVEVARTLQQSKVPYMAVANLEEGVGLRDHGIKTPMLILAGGQDPKYFSVLHRHGLTPVFYDLDYLIAYNEFCQKRRRRGKVHIKFDTGMNRFGFPKSITPKVLKKLPSLRHLDFEGIMTHLANAERPSHHNRQQIKNFDAILRDCKTPFKYIHVSNSGAILNKFEIDENMVRPGLTLYGAYPNHVFKSHIPLEPVMTLKSHVIQLKSVKRGDYISYGYTHRFKENTIVATLPMGYADGMMTYFSNKGEVLIRGKRAPIVGVVTMDAFMVDVGHIRGVSMWDEVIILGKQGKDKITVTELADRVGSIPWEIFCNISVRVPRVYVGY